MSLAIPQFSSVTTFKCRYCKLIYVGIASFHILYSSLFMVIQLFHSMKAELLKDLLTMGQINNYFMLS